MEVKIVLKKLEELGTAQNRKVYKRHGAPDNMFGVSYANLGKLKKEIRSPEGKKGVDHKLAIGLWASGNMDAQVLGSMIAEPLKSTISILREWTDKVTCYQLADALATHISQTQYADQLFEEWKEDNREFARRVGWYIVASQIKNKNFKDNSFYKELVKLGSKILQVSPNRAKEAINNTLIAIGGINEEMRREVELAAKKIGPVEIDHGETSCKTFVIEDYLERIWERKTKPK